MNTDTYEARHLAMAAVALATKIEDDFVATHGGLAAYLLARAREESATALKALVDVDPTDTETIRKLQNDVQRFRDLVRWMADAAEDGDAAWAKLDQGDRAALTNLINPQEQED